MACFLVSCVTQDPVLVGDHDSMDDLAMSLSTVEEHSGVFDAPLLITLDPKFS